MLRALRVAGVVQNYSAPTGLIYLAQPYFQRYYDHDPVRQVALWLHDGVSAEAMAARIEAMPQGERVQVQRNAELRREALRIFDRTFAITGIMGTLAAFVAVIAVISALTALLEERTRVLGYLRAIGLSRRKLGLSMLLEALLLAFTAAVVSWGVGLVMSAVLVFVVNRRAFGWTLQFLPTEGPYALLLVLALLAAALGSAYPMWRATRLSVVATIREE